MHRLRTLGRLCLEDAVGEELVAGLRKDLLLLAWLARRAPRAASRAELAGLLWSDRPEPRARHSLRQVLATLRSVLGPALRTGAEGVSIAPGALVIDVDELLEALSAGRLIETADWQSDFLPGAEASGGESFRSWLDSQRETIRREVAWQFERLHAEAERQNRHADATAWAARWVGLAPFDERAETARLASLRSAGRLPEALAHHRLFAARLHHEMETSPTPEFMSLERELETSLRASPPAPSPGCAALFTPDLVGREAVLAELFAAWHQVRNGESAVVLVEGETGEGKTRLCTEFLRALEREPTATFVLRARGGDETSESAPSTTPAWTTARALFSTLRSAPGLAGAADRDLAELNVLAPTLRERFPQLPPAHGNERGLAAAMARVLEAVTGEVPVVIFVDDFTSADRETQHLLSGFAMRIAAPVLLILAIESEERARTTSLAGLYRIPRVRRLRLRPLDAGEVEALTASMIACPDGVRTALARRLYAETRGNPLFAAEIIASLVDESRLVPDKDGMWHFDDDRSALPLPATVRDAIRRRIARLSEASARALVVASGLAEPWEMAALHARSDLPQDQLATAVDELVGRRFIRQDEGRTGPVRYRLGHPVLGRVLAGGIDRARGETGSTDRSTPGTARLRRVRAGGEARKGKWLRTGLAAAAIVAVAGPIFLATRPASRDPSAQSPPLIAIGLIRDYTGADSSGVANALPEMLATNLARAPHLRVVSQARLYEINAQLGETSLTTAGMARAARAAGAQELIEGELYAASPGQLRLDLRRISLSSGAVQSTQRVTGRDVFKLVDDATSGLAAEFGTPAELHLADITTPSIVAYRFYEEGLRGYYQGDMNRALALFRAALKEDSTFVVAAYYAVLAGQAMGQPPDSVLESRLIAGVDHMPDRTRLFMRAAIGIQTMDPQALDIADSLTIRYPTEPEAHLLHGEILATAGLYISAMAHFREGIALDSLGFRANSPMCSACDAFGGIISILVGIDSFPAAEREVREWIRLQPAAAQPWTWLAVIFSDEGRFEEAQAAKNRAASFEPGHPYDHVFPGILAITGGEFAAADAILGEQVRSAPDPVRREAVWFRVISLRYQGRFVEALEQAREFTRRYPEESGQLAEAQVLYEMGRFREAAALFRRAADRIWPGPLRGTPGAVARQRTWCLTQAANALAADGDTASLRLLADTIQVLGSESLWDRDRRLHNHVRGLLLAARGDHARAADSFLAATHWPLVISSQYNRTNFELARQFVALGRAREAVRPLELALAGPIEASNYYMSRSELHALLGRAYESIGQLDSAEVHYRWTLDAWHDADGVLFARRDSLRTRLDAVEAARRIARSRP